MTLKDPVHRLPYVMTVIKETTRQYMSSVMNFVSFFTKFWTDLLKASE